MRIRIKIDVRKLPKRKKKICRRSGSDCIVQCKYERLGDFCFICGLVTHTERFCSKRPGSVQGDSIREWGSWLRAPLRRTTGQERSRWLRDERDGDWGENHGSSNKKQQYSGVVAREKEIIDISRSDVRAGNNKMAVLVGSQSIQNESHHLGENYIFKSASGPTAEELIGLNMDERKRRRGPEVSEHMDIEGNIGLLQTEDALYHTDCAVSPPELLATLALQASQQQ